jgi:C4-dicarboxylate-specific signal transduction histidine kinase
MAAEAGSENGRPDELAGLQERIRQLEIRVHQDEERRRALVHIMGDLNASNKRLGDQRKAMLHILGDYEEDRSRLARQTDRLDNSRRALLHILGDSHKSNLRLEDSRKAMIHIMDDLRTTTSEMERREHELRQKQEQLVQAGKLATLGELTTGIAHELNNPLNNIGLFVGNVIDRIELGVAEEDKESMLLELESALEQVRKATEIISHLRTFGRAASVIFEPVVVNDVIERSLSLMREQLRLRQISVELELADREAVVLGNPIQLEQVFINLLTNARDALVDAPRRVIHLRRPAAERLRHVRRHRAGNPTQARAAHLRPVLHDEGSRYGDRPGTLDHLRNHPRARRHDFGRGLSRRGGTLPGRAAPGG